MARPKIIMTVKPSEVQIHIVPTIMARKSPKIHPAAKKCCDWEEHADGNGIAI